MKEQTVFIKVPVSDKPKNVYGELIVFGKNGMEIWDDFNSDDDSQIEDLQRLYTHWLKEELPLPETEITAEDILQERIKEYNVEVNDMSKFALTKREVKFFADMMKDYASRMAIQALGRKEGEIELRLAAARAKAVGEGIKMANEGTSEPSKEIITMLTSYVQGNREDYAKEVFRICAGHPTPSMSIEEDFEKIIQELSNKINNCSDNTKEGRARKGAYVDALIMIEDAKEHLESTTDPKGGER